MDARAALIEIVAFASDSHRGSPGPAMKPPLVAHIIHRLAVGGLENGLINLINGTDSRRYRHAIISLTDYTEFRDRIRQPKVPVVAIQKQPGKDFRAYGRLWRVLKELNPAIVHTRNLPALEFLAVAAFAGVGGRVHGEHGRDIYDLDGASRKYKLLRRAVNRAGGDVSWRFGSMPSCAIASCAAHEAP